MKGKIRGRRGGEGGGEGGKRGVYVCVCVGEESYTQIHSKLEHTKTGANLPCP